MKSCKIDAVIVAGGKGLRMESEIRKQYIKISGVPMVAHTIRMFSDSESIGNIVLVVPDSDKAYCLENIIIPYGFDGKVCIVSGGAERQQSVMNGLKKVRELGLKLSKTDFSEKRPNRKIVLIHDGVRPFVEHEVINRCIQGAVEHGACIPVVPVSDTLKQKDVDGFVAGTVDRQNLYKVQTPQAFDLELIIKAHENAMSSGFSATDDASLVEKMGKKVFMTSGSNKNIKITTKDDLLFAEYMASMFVKSDS